jgi:hypothetical protein
LCVPHQLALGEAVASSTTFSRATFTADEDDVLDQDGNKINVDDPDYWQKLMPQAAFAADPRILMMVSTCFVID